VRGKVVMDMGWSLALCHGVTQALSTPIASDSDIIEAPA
jgi:hypothetical protein